MIMTLLSLLVILAIAYIWMTRGFFSALLHMACTIAAGAIAFAAWEPIGYWLLGVVPTRGFGSFLGGIVWGLALVVPFAASLALLRAAVDKLIPANAQCDAAVDYIGGGLCGLVSGVITAGILVLSLGFLRVGPSFLGYRPVDYTDQALGRGSIEKNTSGFVPWADRLTAGLYEHLSLTTFRTGEPLAAWYPDFENVPGSMRMTFEGKSRNTMQASDLQVQGWYIVGDERGGPLGPALMADTWDPNPQKARDLDDELIDHGYLAGFKVQFGPGAKEKAGQVVLGNGQVRLVVEHTDGDVWKTLHPIAVVTSVADPQSTDLARFRYDGQDVFISSVGATSDAPMAFEFAVPTGYTPKALYVKNVRYEVEGPTTEKYASAAERDASIAAGGFIAGRTLAPVGSATPATPSGGGNRNANEPPAGVKLASNISNAALRMGLQLGTFQGMTIDEEADNTIVYGETTLSREGATLFPRERKLRVDRFQATDDTTMVQIDIVGGETNPLIMERVNRADLAQPAVLADADGREYPAIGFTYADREMAKIRFTPGEPLASFSEAPSVSRSRTDQGLTLLFRVNRGVKITEFRIGGEVILSFDPPLNAEQRR